MPKTLIELIEAFELFAVCTDCRRMQKLDLARLIEQFGSDFTVDAVRGRVRCTGCRCRTQQIRIIYVGRGGDAGRFHYRV